MLERYAILGQSGNTVGVLTNNNGYKTIEFMEGKSISEIPLWFKYEYERGIMIVEGDNVEHWIKGRIPPPYRQDIRDILSGLGLETYDTWEIFKKYSGRSVRDKVRIEKIDD